MLVKPLNLTKAFILVDKFQVMKESRFFILLNGIIIKCDIGNYHGKHLLSLVCEQKPPCCFDAFSNVYLFQSNPIQSKGIKYKRLLGAIHIFWLFEKDLWRPVKLCYFASVGLIAFEEAIEQIEKNPATAALHSTRAFESCRRKHNLIAQRLVVFRHCANRNSQQGNHV